MRQFPAVRVLVTGVNGGVGQSILRAAQLFLSPDQLIVGDINANSVAALTNPNFLTLPKVEAKNAYATILQIIQQQKITHVIPGSEYETEFFAQNAASLERTARVNILVAPRGAVKTCNDKLLTSRFFSSSGIPFPATLKLQKNCLSQAARELGFPFIVKPRKGTASRGVTICYNTNELKSIARSRSDLIGQKLLRSTIKGAEYTCAIFRQKSGKLVGPICARRTLRNGSSWAIQIVNPAPFTDYLTKIAGALPYVGTLNVQLILTKQGPIAFELNCRFSGTTSVRAHFGFNDVRWWLLDSLGQNPRALYRYREGAALRYIDEVYFDSSVDVRLV